MIRAAFILALLTLSAQIMGQWETLSGGVYSYQVRRLIYDSTLEQNYVLGGFLFAINDNNDTLVVNGTAIWKNGQWLPMEQGVGVNPVYKAPFTGVIWNGDLYVGGAFDDMDGLPNTHRFAIWNMDHWESWSSVDGNGVVHSIREINGELHAVGSFEGIDGIPIERYGIWDGVTWRDGADTVPDFFAPFLADVIEFQGSTYVSGNFNSNNDPHDIAKLGPNGWESLGDGLSGDPWVFEMIEYNGLLYVCGQIFGSGSLYSRGVIAWDGNQWIKPFPGIEWLSYVRDMEIIGGRLVINGTVRVENTIERFGLFYFDGTTACLAGGENVWTWQLGGMADTVYVSTCETLTCQPGGMVTNGIAKWVFTNAADTCLQIVTGIEELPEPATLSISPNPAITEVTIQLNNKGRGRLELFDMFGRRVLSQSVGDLHSNYILDLPELKSGTYLLRWTSEDGNENAHARLVILR